MSQDKLSLQVTVYVPADRNQSAPQDTTPFVVFPLRVTGTVVLFSFYSNPNHFSKEAPKFITVHPDLPSASLQPVGSAFPPMSSSIVYLILSLRCLTTIHPITY